MGLASGVVILFAACATLLLDRAIAIRPKLAIARRGIHLVPPRGMLRAMPRQHIRWIGATEFARLIEDNPNLVVFRLIDAHLVAEEHGKPADVVAVTIDQLANTIPWIPCGNQIVIYRLGGISAQLAAKVKGVLRGREALFFSGDAHQAVETMISEPDFAA